jgi:hypothetical protein
VGTLDGAAVTESTTMVDERGFGINALGLFAVVGLVLLLATAVTECLIPRDDVVEMVASFVLPLGLFGSSDDDDGNGINPAAAAGRSGGGGGGGDGLLLVDAVSIEEVQSSSKSAISL